MKLKIIFTKMDKGEFSFTTELDNGDIYGLNRILKVPEVDIDCGRPKGTVKWHLEFDARERGIKGISIVIDSFTCEMEWEVSGVEDLSAEEKALLIGAGGTENLIGTISQYEEINSNAKYREREWKIDSSEFNFYGDGQCMPSDYEIYFEEMIIKIS